MPAHRIEDAVLAASSFFQQMYGDKGLKDVLLDLKQAKVERFEGQRRA
jgi:hypothetical protein